LAQHAFLVRRPRAEGAQALAQGFDVDGAHEVRMIQALKTTPRRG
jgi:hypothetical protein